jgi:hypothetical protein
MKKTSIFFSNSFKGIIMLLAASLVFVFFLSVFPLIGSLTTGGFPLGSVMLDNLQLLIMLCLVSIPLGFFLGFLVGKLKKKRIFWMIILGFIFYWLMILLIIMIMAKFSFSGNDFSDILRLSAWAMLAYSMFAVPLVILAVFLLERWTRKK